MAFGIDRSNEVRWHFGIDRCDACFIIILYIVHYAAVFSVFIFKLIVFK